MPKNSQWSFFRNSPNNVSKVLMRLTTLSPLGRSYTYSCNLLLKMWVPYILLKFFQVSCSDLVWKCCFGHFLHPSFQPRIKGKKFCWLSPVSEHVCRAECTDPNRRVHFVEERAPPKGAQKQLPDPLDRRRLKSQSAKLRGCISALLWSLRDLFLII